MVRVWIDVPELERFGDPVGVGDAVVWPVIVNDPLPEWEFLIKPLHIDWCHCVDHSKASPIWGVVRSVKGVWFDWTTGDVLAVALFVVVGVFGFGDGWGVLGVQGCGMMVTLI